MLFRRSKPTVADRATCVLAVCALVAAQLRSSSHARMPCPQIGLFRRELLVVLAPHKGLPAHWLRPHLRCARAYRRQRPAERINPSTGGSLRSPMRIRLFHIHSSRIRFCAAQAPTASGTTHSFRCNISRRSWLQVIRLAFAWTASCRGMSKASCQRGFRPVNAMSSMQQTTSGNPTNACTTRSGRGGRAQGFFYSCRSTSHQCMWQHILGDYTACGDD